MNVVMRADASPELGTGHVSRCLSIAAALQSRGATVQFVTRPHGDYSSRLFADSGVAVIPLLETDAASGRLSWSEDAAATRTALTSLGTRPAWLIVDHYGLDERWERRLRPHAARIMAIDDLANRSHDADVLLDSNLCEDAEQRYRGKLPEGCLQLLGPRHAPLRNEFIDRRRAVEPRSGHVDRIFVFHGGGLQAARCTLAGIAAIAGLALRNTAVDVVFNADSRDIDSVAAACNRNGFRLHRATRQMAELMADAGLAVGAGGATLWERCCLGLPCLTFALAENQREQVRQAALQGIVLAPSIAADDVDALAKHVSACLEDPALLASVSRRAMSMVDGRGTERLMRALGMLQVSVRNALAADCRAVYEWRNEVSVRAASRDSAPIDYESHRRWFSSVLSDPARVLLVGEAGGRPVGVVRYDVDGRSAIVSIYLAPGKAGRGLGADLLSAAESRLSQSRPEVERVIAEVLGDNEPSHRLFLSAGFALSESRYVKELR